MRMLKRYIVFLQMCSQCVQLCEHEPSLQPLGSSSVLVTRVVLKAWKWLPVRCTLCDLRVAAEDRSASMASWWRKVDDARFENGSLIRHYWAGCK